MKFVIWELILPLLIAFVLGLFLGWLMWRWRHRKVTSNEWQSVLAESSARQTRVTELENLLGDREREVIALQADTAEIALGAEFEKTMTEVHVSLAAVEQERDAARDQVAELETRLERATREAFVAGKKTHESQDLKQIKGIGPKLEKSLNSFGITTLTELASLDEVGINELQNHLDQFPGRVEREQWVSQARSLLEYPD